MRDTPTAPGAYVEVAGAPLYYEDAGDGPALVLLHQGLADSRMYDDQFAALAQHYHVVRYDLHGFGRSGTPTAPYTHHAALHALLNHLGIARTALVGMSLGGSIALDVALTYPERVGALLLLATGLAGYPVGEATAALAAPLGAAFAAGAFARAIDLSVRLWVDGPRRGPEQVDPAVRERFRTLYTDVLRRTRERGRPADLLDPPASTRLDALHVPTLIVVGSGDVPDVLDQAELLARGIAGACKVVLPHLAHLFNMERPQEVNALLLTYLAQQYGADDMRQRHAGSSGSS